MRVFFPAPSIFFLHPSLFEIPRFISKSFLSFHILLRCRKKNDGMLEDSIYEYQHA